jgi:hypothetical protein
MRSLVELPRAVAGAVGLEDHPWNEDLPSDASVAQFDPDIERDDPRTAETIERRGLGEDAIDRLTSPQSAAVAGDLKLVDVAGRELVYDLASDPHELQPVPADGDRAAELAVLRAALRHPAVTAVGQPAATPRGADQPSADELADLEARMRLLGYM